MSPRHIVITGAMGVGKTTLGVALAEQLGAPFVDSDERLFAEHRKSARQIAEAHGVAHLHRLEHDLVSRVITATEPTVIAAAASIADNQTLLSNIVSEGSNLVYVEADPGDLVARSEIGTHRRPIDRSTTMVLTQSRRKAALSIGAILINNSDAQLPSAVVAQLMEIVGD